MITIPCDYRDGGNSARCGDLSYLGVKKGQVLIYGEMGGRLPEVITCPKCNGTGFIQVTRESIEADIAELEDEREYINKEISRLKELLL